MSIINAKELQGYISTSVASYATLDKGNLKLSLTSSQLGGDFADKQADEFINNYSLLHQQPNTSSGFSAAVFEDTSGKKVLAIRGTEFTITGAYDDLIQTDFLDIGPSGYADDRVSI